MNWLQFFMTMGLVVPSAMGVALYKTKPKDEDLKAAITRSMGASGIFEKTAISVALTTGVCKSHIQDFVLAKVAQVEYGGQVHAFVGILGTWIRVASAVH
jgi:hypothetical protein